MSSLMMRSQAFETPLEVKIHRATQSMSRQMQWRLFTILLVFSDGLFIGLAFLTAYWIRFNLNIPLFQLEVMPSLPYYRTLVVLMVPSWLTIFWIKGLYNRNNLLGGTKEYSELFNASTMGFVMVIAGSFILRELDFARGWLLLSWVLSFLFTAAGRFFIRRFVYYLRQYGYFVSQAVIVGANEEGILLAEQLVQWKTSGFHILGFVDKKIKPGDRIYKNLICLGNLEQIADVIDQYEITDLILATSAISSRDKMVEIFKRYGMDSDINVRFSSGLYEIITTGLTVNQFAFVPLVGVNPVRMTGVDQAIKMIVDILLTSVGLVLLSPIMVFIALLVHFDSPGPIIHRRRVVGMNGKHFDAFKFRTMYVNGDELLAGRPELQQELAENHKLKVDPRITKVGKYLRKLSLDELPQLFNVLRGEMSLVGPRMITQEEMAKYDKWDLNLVTVRPGITGLWQVSGRSDISYEERVRLDMYYIRNWNIWLDVQLILQTIPAVLKSRGAY